MHHFYLLFLQVMVDVVRSLVSENRILSYPFCKLVCWLLGWIPTRAISLWPAVFMDMALFTTLLKSYIWPGRLPSSRATTISTSTALEINLLQSIIDQMFNDHSVCLWKWRLVLRLFFYGSRFPPLWIHKIVVFSCSLFYKGLVGYEILLWYDIYTTHEVSW